MTELSGGGRRVHAVLPAGTWKEYDSLWRIVVAVVSGPPLADRSICDVDVAESTQEHREFIAGVRDLFGTQLVPPVVGQSRIDRSKCARSPFRKGSASLTRALEELALR